jgi:hypothetical protein
MNYLDNIQFQYYPGQVNITTPLGYTNLRNFIRSHKSPKPKMVEVFNNIAAAEASGDMELKSNLKKNNLYYFNPCVILDGKNRSYANILRFTGLMVVDIDHIEDAEVLRDLLFERFKFIAVAYVSPSKKGLKLLIRIPIVKTVDEFKSYFHGLCHYFCRYIGFDDTAQNPVLPLFISMDKGLRYREDATVWKIRGYKENAFKVSTDENFEPIKDASEEDKKIALNIIKKIIKRADDDQVGHSNVRTAGLVAGGYAAYGYLTAEEAENALNNYIEGSEYLSKNLNGYLKTANEMFNRGLSSPLEIEKNG